MTRDELKKLIAVEKALSGKASELYLIALRKAAKRAFKAAKQKVRRRFRKKAKVHREMKARSVHEEITI